MAEVRNPIGAGDVLASALAAALERGEPLAAAARAGVAAASASVEHPTAGDARPRARAGARRPRSLDIRPSGALASAASVTTLSRPTMRDVAQQAGVSLKTVSRVINAEAGVTPATAAKVTEAIDALGFERNDLARSLRQGRSSSTLGLVIEDVANPFYSAVAQAVEAVARERGFLLITASAREDAERERELVGALLRRRVDALLIVPAGPDHRYISERHAAPSSSTARRRGSRPTPCCSTTSAAPAAPSST